MLGGYNHGQERTASIVHIPLVSRSGLDRLRDHAALVELDMVLVTAPDRLSRNYAHQVLLIEELTVRAAYRVRSGWRTFQERCGR